MGIYIVQFNQHQGDGWQVAMEVFKDRARAEEYAKHLCESLYLDYETSIVISFRRVI